MMKPIIAPWGVIGYEISDTRKAKGCNRVNKIVRARHHKISQKMFEPSGTIFYKPAIVSR